MDTRHERPTGAEGSIELFLWRQKAGPRGAVGGPFPAARSQCQELRSLARLPAQGTQNLAPVPLRDRGPHFSGTEPSPRQRPGLPGGQGTYLINASSLAGEGLPEVASMPVPLAQCRSEAVTTGAAETRP